MHTVAIYSHEDRMSAHRQKVCTIIRRGDGVYRLLSDDNRA